MMGRYRLQEKANIYHGIPFTKNGVIVPGSVMHQMNMFLEDAMLVFVDEKYRILREGKAYHSADLDTVKRELPRFLEDVKRAYRAFVEHSKYRISDLFGVAAGRKGVVSKLRYLQHVKTTTKDEVEKQNIQDFLDVYMVVLGEVMTTLNEVIAEDNRRLAAMGSSGKNDPIELITLAEVLREAWVRHWDK